MKNCVKFNFQTVPINLPTMKSFVTLFTKALFIPLAFLFVSAESDLVTLTIHNDSDYSIYYLYLSNSESSDWGEDRLGDEVLSTGESFATLVYPSRYDIKLIDEDDDVCVNYNINISGDLDWRFGNTELLDCMGYGSSSSNSSTVEFTIRNNSSWSIYYVYMSSPDEGWGPDQLGSEVISSGGDSFTLRVRPGTYDLKLVDEDGDECTNFGISVQNDLTWSFGDTEWLECID